MHRSRNLTIILVLAVAASGLLRPDPVAAQVTAPAAAPPLIGEVGRLVSRHFYDPGTVERLWAGARAPHT